MSPFFASAVASAASGVATPADGCEVGTNYACVEALFEWADPSALWDLLVDHTAAHIPCSLSLEPAHSTLWSTPRTEETPLTDDTFLTGSDEWQ